MKSPKFWSSKNEDDVGDAEKLESGMGLFYAIEGYAKPTSCTIQNCFQNIPDRILTRIKKNLTC